MARLLLPETFGLMALSNILIVGLALFSDLGLRQNIVQSQRGDDPAYLNTAWSVQIARGLLIWVAAILIGVALHVLAEHGVWQSASAYADPQLPIVVAVLSFNAVISGFESTKLAQAGRSLALERVVRLEIISQVFGLAVMVPLAYASPSIWALVVGALLSNMIKVFLSHAALPGIRNTLAVDREALKEILHFGKWIFLTSIMGFVAANGDRLVLGSLVDATTLGLYAIAFLIVSAIQDVFVKLISNVAFPAFGEVNRQNRDKLKEIYYRFRLPVDLATLFSTGFLMAGGHLIVASLYDYRYRAAGHMLEVLCLVLFEVRYWLSGQCFLALGKPKLLTPIAALRMALIFLGVPIAFRHFGLSGALWAIALSTLATLPVTLMLKLRNDLFDLRRELVVLPVLAVGYAVGMLASSIYQHWFGTTMP